MYVIHYFFKHVNLCAKIMERERNEATTTRNMYIIQCTTHRHFMIDEDEKLFLGEDATCVLLKLGCDINSTANGASGVNLSLHLVSTPHASIVTNPIGRVLINWRALQHYNYRNTHKQTCTCTHEVLKDTVVCCSLVALVQMKRLLPI